MTTTSKEAGQARTRMQGANNRLIEMVGYARQLQVRASGLDQQVKALSGGNQQKVVLAKWLATDPAVLILDEPTRGIDIGAKAEVHRIISDLAARGLAIILISSELPEVLAMADRVLVMHEGRITGTFTRSEATQERVMFAATGQERGGYDCHESRSGTNEAAQSVES